MINKPEEEIRDVLNAQQPASRNFKQSFQFGNRTVIHTHHLQVEVTMKNIQKVEIFNHFATSRDEKITKLTEIHFQNRIIKIFDSFSYDNNRLTNNITNNVQSETLPNSNTDPRINIWKKKYANNQIQGQQPKGRDTKNVVKNIIKLFKQWVKTHQADKQIFQQSLKRLVAKDKYNNRLILNLSKDQVLRRSFIDFTDNSGQECINKSKINDKQSHLQALKKYRRICGEQQSRHGKKQQQMQMEVNLRKISVEPQ